MAENTPARTRRRDEQRRAQFIEECRSSKIIVPVTLTPGVERLYRSSFDNLSRAAFLLRFYCRIAPSLNNEQAIFKEINGWIEEARAGLEKRINVANKKLADEGVQLVDNNLRAKNVTVVDPVAHLFLRFLLDIQTLETRLTALWLSCLIDDATRNQAMQDISRQLNVLRGRVTEVSLASKKRYEEDRDASRQASRAEASTALEPAATASEAETLSATSVADAVSNVKNVEAA